MQLSGPLIRPREWKEREREGGLSINKVCGTNSLVSHVPETERGSHFKIWNSIWLTFNMDESSFVLDSKLIIKIQISLLYFLPAAKPAGQWMIIGVLPLPVKFCEWSSIRARKTLEPRLLMPLSSNLMSEVIQALRFKKPDLTK